MPKITKRLVDQLSAEGGKIVYIWDDTLPGFGVKRLASGKKRYILKYRPGGGGRTARQRWLMLGSHGAITLEQARKQARVALAAIAQGEDPQGSKSEKRSSATVTDCPSSEHLAQLAA